MEKYQACVRSCRAAEGQLFSITSEKPCSIIPVSIHTSGLTKSGPGSLFELPIESHSIVTLEFGSHG